MRVLVMGAPGPATDEAVAQIERAGHEVVRCHDPGEPPFPCKALTAACPLDEVAIDAALAVRTHAWPRPTVFDRGVTCAVRQRVPVVLAGTTVLNPYENWAADVVDRGADVVEALERAVAGPCRRHEEVATAALRESLSASGIDPEPGTRAEVARQDGWLKVRLHAPRGIPRVKEQNVARRVIGALRAYDRHSRGIDVQLGPGRHGQTWGGGA